MPCAFCRIIAGHDTATIVRAWTDALAIVPLEPVTSGHLIVIPHVHVPDALIDPRLTGRVTQRAAELAQPDCNLITSVGTAATQTVRHLHIHIVPRRAGDGLLLPWSVQQGAEVTEQFGFRSEDTGDVTFVGWSSTPPDVRRTVITTPWTEVQS